MAGQGEARLGLAGRGRARKSKRVDAARPGRARRGEAGQGKVRKGAKMETIRKVKASRLILDFSLYPRERLDSYHVKAIADSLRAGVLVPPILVDRKSKRVVDGFHRVRAYQKVYGPHRLISAILKVYPDEASMFLDAVTANATHGRSLSIWDKARCIAQAEALKLEPAQVASALGLTVERLVEMKAQRLATYGMEPVALKRTAAHFAGEELTEAQSSYNLKAGGLPQGFYVHQVIAMLELDAVDWKNEGLVKALRRLHDLLGKALLAKV